MIELDGSYGEGGGQILRTALSLSAVTLQPVTLHNIRGGRAKPGLQAQHLACVHAAAHICRAKVTGNHPGSTVLQFIPTRPVQSGDYRFEIGTAGSTSLVLHTVAVPLALAEGPSAVEITGGTHVPNAPTSCDLMLAWAPAMAQFGLDVDVSAPQLGFYPKGGGMIRADIAGGAILTPARLLEPGTTRSATAVICTANLPDHVAERGERELRGRLEPKLKVTVEKRNEMAHSTGAAVCVGVETRSAVASFHTLGERGKPMETVCREAAVELVNWLKSGCVVDVRLADQMVLPAALAKGETVFTTPRLSQHLQTVIWVARQFTEMTAETFERPEGGYRVEIRNG